MDATYGFCIDYKAGGSAELQSSERKKEAVLSLLLGSENEGGAVLSGYFRKSTILYWFPSPSM